MDHEEKMCSLQGSELAARAAEWQEITRAASSRITEKGKVISTYPLDEDLLRRMRALIAAEGECCSFLRFDLRERRDDFVVELHYPDEMSQLVEMALGLERSA